MYWMIYDDRWRLMVINYLIVLGNIKVCKVKEKMGI